MNPETYSENDKIWRFSGAVIDCERHMQYSWPETVPVYAGGVLIGFASIVPQGRGLVAHASVRYDLPERLDHDTGQELVLFPLSVARTKNKTVRRIHSLHLTPAPKGDKRAISTLEEL